MFDRFKQLKVILYLNFFKVKKMYGIKIFLKYLYVYVWCLYSNYVYILIVEYIIVYK